MESFISNTADDAQTAITSLGAAVAGAASEKLGNYAIRQVGSRGNSFGDVGTRFILRSLISSAIFGATASLMPQTSGNIFFSIVFFAANFSLVSDAVTLGQIVVSGVPNPLIILNPAKGPGPGISAASSSGGCGSSCGNK